MLGSRRACEEAAAAALMLRQDVVIDRCNFDASQRATWLHLARQHRAYPMAFHLDVPVEECIRRAQARTEHPTMNSGSAAAVIRGFACCLLLDCFRRGCVCCTTWLLFLWSAKCVGFAQFCFGLCAAQCERGTPRSVLSRSAMLPCSSSNAVSCAAEHAPKDTHSAAPRLCKLE